MDEKRKKVWAAAARKPKPPKEPVVKVSCGQCIRAAYYECEGCPTYEGTSR